MKTAVEWLAEIKQGQKEQPFDDHEWQIAFEHAKLIEIDQMRAVHMMTYMNKDFDFEQYIKEHYEQSN
jgi:hypothetical protein